MFSIQKRTDFVSVGVKLFSCLSALGFTVGNEGMFQDYSTEMIRTLLGPQIKPYERCV